MCVQLVRAEAGQEGVCEVRYISRVQGRHVDTTTLEKIDVEFVPQAHHNVRSKAGVCEHAALGENVVPFAFDILRHKSVMGEPPHCLKARSDGLAVRQPHSFECRVAQNLIIVERGVVDVLHGLCQNACTHIGRAMGHLKRHTSH